VNIYRFIMMNERMLCNLMSEYLGLVYRSVGGVQLHVYMSMKGPVVCRYISACQWRAQWCAVTCLHVNEGPSGVQLHVNEGPSGVQVHVKEAHIGEHLHVCMSLKAPVVCRYMSACQ
jgi:hypothetical protein